MNLIALSLSQYEKNIWSSLKFKSDSSNDITLTGYFSSIVVGCSFFHSRQTCIHLGTAVIAKICRFHYEMCLRYLVGSGAFKTSETAIKESVVTLHLVSLVYVIFHLVFVFELELLAFRDPWLVRLVPVPVCLNKEDWIISFFSQMASQARKSPHLYCMIRRTLTWKSPKK